MALGRWSLARLAAALVLCVAVLAGLGTREGRAQDGQPVTCRLGANVEAIYDIDIANERFGAEFWLWTLCPNGAVDPLQSVTFPSATRIAPSPIASVPTGDERVYRYRRIQGTFRQDFDMRAYPFDRQRVVIPIDEFQLGAGSVLFEADPASFLTPDSLTNRREWQAGDFALTTSVSEEQETYGLPNVAMARYARAEIAFTLSRVGMLTFVKLSAGVVAAGVIAMMSFFYDGRESKGFTSRMGLLIGALFAVLVNLRTADTALGDMGQMTLVTELHLLTLLLILALAAMALRDWWRAEGALPVEYPNWTQFGWTAALYLLGGACLIGRAAGWA